MRRGKEEISLRGKGYRRDSLVRGGGQEREQLGKRKGTTEGAA
jgi:hypothetical protein